MTTSPRGSVSEAAAVAFTAYRTGEPERLGDLVDLLNPILWQTARAQGATSATAEDAVQTAWLRLVDHADSIIDPRAVLAWLVVTVKRESWRLVGNERRVVDVEALPELASDDVGPETTSILRERQHVLWRHVSALSDRCRELLRVVAFADRPDYAAIAEALDMPMGSIGPTRGRCLQKLRDLLAADPSWSLT
ncbi:MAG: sigma-70 family RNA polymerase sigma factor [Nostocoides sp.]